MLLEVVLMEVWIHIQTGRSEVKGAGDIRDDALATLSDTVQSHPHVPVPQLEGGGATEGGVRSIMMKTHPLLILQISYPPSHFIFRSQPLHHALN